VLRFERRVAVHAKIIKMQNYYSLEGKFVLRLALPKNCVTFQTIERSNHSSSIIKLMYFFVTAHRSEII
jgi:hypothetical protein